MIPDTTRGADSSGPDPERTRPPGGDRTSRPPSTPEATTVDAVQAPRVQPPPAPALPTFGGARLEWLDELGGGGMGLVSRARDHLLGRDVAVKVLRPKYRDDPEMVLRFRAEAQVLGQLQHPGIPPLYDVGTLPDGLPYFTMKLVRGQTLDKRLGADPGAQEKWFEIFRQVAEAVGYAHECDVVHRDLKPANVMVGAHGEVQVMDWGLAKVLRRPDLDPEAPVADAVATVRSSDSAHDSVSGRVLGTYAYMAPEQARGEVDRVDKRADVFSLGSILCRLLTGKPAYAGEDVKEVAARAIGCDTAEALSRLDACGGDPILIGLARECLRPAPADRPPDARAVAERVADHLAGMRARLDRAERDLAIARVRMIEEEKQRRLADQLGMQKRRRRRTALALALALLGLVAFGGGATVWFVQDRRIQRQRERLILDQAESALAQAEAAGDPEADESYGAARIKSIEAIAVVGGHRVPPPGWVGGLGRWLESNLIGTEARRETSTRAWMLNQRWERLDQSRRLLAELELARAYWSDRVEGGGPPDLARAEQDYQRIFRSHNLDVASPRPEAFAAAVQGHRARVEVAAALDDWARIRRRFAPGPDQASWRDLVALARRVDPDPGRDRLRALWLRPAGPGAAALIEFSEKEQALERQSAAGSLLLAELLAAAGEPDRALAVLQAAWRRHPEDDQVNSRIAMSSYSPHSGQFERPEQAARHLTAAVARRPSSPLALARLGLALRQLGQHAEAQACDQAALRLGPEAAAAVPPIAATKDTQGTKEGKHEE